MGGQYSASCQCGNKDEDKNETLFNSIGNSNHDKNISEKNRNEEINTIQYKKSIKFLGNHNDDMQVNESNGKRVHLSKSERLKGDLSLNNYSNYVIDSNDILNEPYVEDLMEENTIKPYETKSRREIQNNIRLNIKSSENIVKVSDPLFSSHQELTYEKTTERKKNNDKSKNNTTFVSSKKQPEVDIYELISEEDLLKINDFEIIYQSDLMRYNFKISATFNHNVSYSSRFALFSKRDIRLYKSKESFLHLFPPNNIFEVKLINYCSKVTINNKKGVHHLSFIYNYPDYASNPVFNEYYSSSDHSIVFKEISKENKFYLEHKHFKDFCEHLVILAASTKEEIDKWMAILRYCVSNNLQ